MSRILVVDDSASIAQALRWVLESDGHDVITVTEGMRGLLDISHPLWDDRDVLICDLMMPDVSGVDVLRVCQIGFPHMKRICLTAVGNSSEEAQAARRVAHTVLLKPTPFDEILSVVGGTDDRE